MADLDDLGITSITDMSKDEAIDLLRQIRLSRRTPVKSTKTSTTKSRKKQTPDLTAEQAAALLALIGGSNE